MKLSFFIDSAHPAKAKTPFPWRLAAAFTDEEETAINVAPRPPPPTSPSSFPRQTRECRRYAPQFPPSRQPEVFVSDEAFNDGGRVTFPNRCCQPPCTLSRSPRRVGPPIDLGATRLGEEPDCQRALPGLLPREQSRGTDRDGQSHAGPSGAPGADIASSFCSSNAGKSSVSAHSDGRVRVQAFGAAVLAQRRLRRGPRQSPSSVAPTACPG